MSITTKQNDQDLKRSSYNFDLPPELIAARPAQKRDHSRLLVYKAKSNEIIHTHFHELPNHLPQNSHLVLNQSKVFPCRLIGRKASGGKVEVFLLSLIDEQGQYPCMIKSSGKKREGDEVFFEGGVKCTIIKANGDATFAVAFDLERDQFQKFLYDVGKIPIPPYIRKGESDEKDESDYQTVFAKELGSVAAPTAGLHFTQDVFDQLSNKGIEKSFVTLHVGAGTFLPVKTDDIKDHKMHSEYFTVDSQNLKRLREHDGDLISVGTTSLRVLETLKTSTGYQMGEGEFRATDIFLHPGVEVQSIKGLLTNFHLPESTLLMLVSSLIGRERCLALYKEATQMQYRFFSYGDAMLILRDQ